jgi:sporulation protein YlmC with PRC-barrel domain
MDKSLGGVCLLLSLLIAGHTAAQTSPSPPPPPESIPSSATNEAGTPSLGSVARGTSFLAIRQPDQFRSSNLRGTRVYGANNENIGEINDVLINRSGQVVAVIIGVGGFLGLGAKDVAVPMSTLLFQPGAAAANPSAATPASTTDSAAPNTAVAPPATSAAARHDNGVPDRIILTMTKEQLQNAPEFQENPNERSSNTEPSRPTTPAAPVAPKP